ncbi:MAG: hypothetical protein GWP06_00830 [Actinobacteria bacterium]|nr:hypothetical protein [Actinomycetota bacterium]
MFKKSSLFIISGLLVILLSCSTSQNSYRTTVGTGEDQISVVVVQGTPLEMGRAYGRLMKKEIHACMTAYLATAQAALPERFSDANLDAAWNSISPYLSTRFTDELRGLSEGADIDLQTLKRAHAVPVLGDYACSGVAVWGDAVAGDHLYQLRNLDFVKQAHLQDYPVIVIYKPTDGIPHAIVAFAGYIGAHTGMNAEGIVLGEKGESPESEYPFDLDGTHFSTLFRDLLYNAQNLNQVLDTIKSTKLIKRYYLYVSDGKKETQGAAKIRVSSPDPVKLTIWKDNDPTDEMAPNVLKNVIYFTMKNDVAFKMLKENYGKFNAEKMIALSRAVADEGGNLVDVVYDATALEMWVAFAEKDKDASTRPYVHINLKDYLD